MGSRRVRAPQGQPPKMPTVPQEDPLASSVQSLAWCVNSNSSELDGIGDVARPSWWSKSIKMWKKFATLCLGFIPLRRFGSFLVMNCSVQKSLYSRLYKTFFRVFHFVLWSSFFLVFRIVWFFPRHVALLPLQSNVMNVLNEFLKFSWIRAMKPRRILSQRFWIRVCVCLSIFNRKAISGRFQCVLLSWDCFFSHVIFSFICHHLPTFSARNCRTFLKPSSSKIKRIDREPFLITTFFSSSG